MVLGGRTAFSRTSSRSLNEWRNDVHLLAREKGWWDGTTSDSSTSVLAKLALCVSELSEAVELVREPDFDPKAVWAAGPEGVRVPYALLAMKAPKLPKPEGFGTEISDAVIRVLDLMGSLELEINEPRNFLDVVMHEKVVSMTADMVLAVIMRVNVMLAKAADIVDERPPSSWDVKDRSLFRGWMSSATIMMCVLCASLGVDVGLRIAEKHAYNVTREKRHGGRRA
jgi:hypothetical protein